ncbi:hypothetical protein Q3G72_020321 [Acer saccharum]|nr:hypothetical protein Q3G72_020321 [Acer saccharum]
MSNGDLFKFQRTFEDGRRKAPFDSSICPPLDQALDEIKGENPTATFVQRWIEILVALLEPNAGYKTK